MKVPFDAIAYPNPFSQSVNINVATSVSSDIQINVYDMTGRLLEHRSVNAADAESLTIGESYPAGVYNVILTQGDEVKTLRVVKR